MLLNSSEQIEFHLKPNRLIAGGLSELTGSSAQHTRGRGSISPTETNWKYFRRLDDDREYVATLRP